jgi:hypothetical protein
MTSRTLMLFTLVASIQVFASTPAETVPAPVKEHREHYDLRDADGLVHYEITDISRISDDLYENFVLVRDPDHGSFLLISRLSWADGQSSHSLTDIRQKDYIRVSFAMPTRAKTVEQAIAEGVLLAPVILTLTTNGGEGAGVDTEWKEWSKLRTLRHSVRRTVPFYLLEALERMRGAVLTTVAAPNFYNLIGRLVLYDTQDEPQLRLENVEQPPACDFDKSFGYPCSAAQLKRIRKAQDSGKPLSSY